MASRGAISGRRWLSFGLAALLGPLLVALLLDLTFSRGRITDWWVNTTYDSHPKMTVTLADRQLHRSLFIVDLHADTLMWRRDLLARSKIGHLDLPRLIEGNVAVQVFAVVTKVTVGTTRPSQSSEDDTCESADSTDGTVALRMFQLLPPRQWFDPEAAALGQAERLGDFVRISQARHDADPRQPFLKLILTAADLAHVIELRRAGQPVVGALLALEGVHWIGADGASSPRDSLQRLYDAGFRMLAPTHRFDNNLGASSTGCMPSIGLTRQGVAFVRAAEQQGMIVDMAHASDSSVLQAADRSDGPIVVSHTGVRRFCAKSHCSLDRTLGDAEIRAIARTGGVIGIGYWTRIVGVGTDHIAQSFQAAYDVMSNPAFLAEMRKEGRHFDPLEHLAFGSDFDGANSMPFDAAGLAALTSALRRRFDERALRLMAGGNACRVLATELPNGGPGAADRICGALTREEVATQR